MALQLRLKKCKIFFFQNAKDLCRRSDFEMLTVWSMAFKKDEKKLYFNDERSRTKYQ